MKRLLLLLAGLLLVCPAYAETAPKAATLVRSSFAGGGYEYTALAEDPSIVAISSVRDSGGQEGEIVAGAAYDVVFTFTGLRPGETAVWLLGRSPILENDDTLYSVKADEALNVTLTPVRALSTFYLYRSGEIYTPSWHISREKDGYRASVNEGPEQRIGTDAAEALMRVIEKWDVAAWNGFHGSRDFVLDGESFWLEIGLTDGTKILAQGDNIFPAHYFEAVSEMQAILDGIAFLPDGTANASPKEETAMEKTAPTLIIEANGHAFSAVLEENASAQALIEKLGEGAVEINLKDFGHFEKVGPLPWSLPRCDENITTAPGDVILYQGNQITVYYDENTWDFTRLAKIPGVTKDDLLAVFGEGNVAVRFRIEGNE